MTDQQDYRAVNKLCKVGIKRCLLGVEMSAIADSAGKYKYAENQINCCLTFHFVYYDRGTTILRVNRCVVCDLVNYTLIQAWAIIIYSCHR